MPIPHLGHKATYDFRTPQCRRIGATTDHPRLHIAKPACIWFLQSESNHHRAIDHQPLHLPTSCFTQGDYILIGEPQFKPLGSCAQAF